MGHESVDLDYLPPLPPPYPFHSLVVAARGFFPKRSLLNGFLTGG